MKTFACRIISLNTEQSDNAGTVVEILIIKLSSMTLTFWIFHCKFLCFSFEANSFLLDLEHALQCCLVTGWHLPCEMEDVDVLRNGELTVTNGWQQRGFAWGDRNSSFSTNMTGERLQCLNAVHYNYISERETVIDCSIAHYVLFWNSA